jgi:hypothetical protein
MTESFSSVPWARREGVSAGPSGMQAGLHSAIARVNSFVVPQVAYADDGRRNSL